MCSVSKAEKVSPFCAPVLQVWSWHRHGGSRRVSPASRCAWQPCVVVPAGGIASVAQYWPPASAALRNSTHALPPSKPAADI